MVPTSGDNPSQLHEAIRRRATELYQQTGGVEGQDVENWHQAEAEILRESAAHAIRRAVVVNLEGVVYTGEYSSVSSGGYTPGEWNPGDRVRVRLQGDKLFLRRRNGQEMETTVVKRIG